MSIFSRRKGTAASAPADPGDVDADLLGEAEPQEAGPAHDQPASSADVADRADAAAAAPSGPHDVTDVAGQGGRVDLGSLWVGGVQGLELRLEMDQATSQVIAATLVVGESAAQVQAFAAPKSAGLWDEIRSEIAGSIAGQGGTAEEVDGPLGTELRTRMPSAGPDGRTVFAPARFLGIDGPRWFLRVVLSGRAAIDEAAAAPLVEVVRDIVVVRGQDPMAPRELLPLAVPSDASDEAAPAVEPTPGSADLSPFERGPEITEVH